MAKKEIQKKNTAKKKGILSFIKETKNELKKVIWPTRKQLLNNTVIVFASIAVVAVIIWVLDNVFKLSLGLIL